jgi:hypothetical protein
MEMLGSCEDKQWLLYIYSQFNVVAGPVIINAKELCRMGLHSHWHWSLHRKNRVCHKLALRVDHQNEIAKELAWSVGRKNGVC